MTQVRSLPVRILIPLLTAGALLLALGWLLPAQKHSLPIAILMEAGHNSLQTGGLATQLLRSDRPGPVDLMVDWYLASLAVAPSESSPGSIDESHSPYSAGEIPGWIREWERYRERHPGIAALGTWEALLTQIYSVHPEPEVTRPVMDVLMYGPVRRHATGLLVHSRSPAVQAVLGIRHLTGWRQFLPVSSASGQPLEATMVLAALLLQTDRLPLSLTTSLRGSVLDAMELDDLVPLESFLLDLLFLGRRLNWGQLTELLSRLSSFEEIAQVRGIFQLEPDRLSMLYTAMLLHGSPAMVAGYLKAHGPSALPDLTLALQTGQGALKLLVEESKPVSGSAEGNLWLNALGLGGLQSHLVRFALEMPRAAIFTKYALFFSGVWAFVLAFTRRASPLSGAAASPWVGWAGRSSGALLTCLFLFLLSEPHLSYALPQAAYSVSIEFVPVPAELPLGTELHPLTPAVFAMQPATILSISFFFLLQALVYLVCLMKIKEISRQEVSSLIKLKLMENEDNLFDAGLYVGIAGTCTALVLQVLGAIEANLLAAYSSNLMGILCVAIVKIRHVRPYKCSLIIESQEQLRLSDVKS